MAASSAEASSGSDSCSTCSCNPGLLRSASDRPLLSLPDGPFGEAFQGKEKVDLDGNYELTEFIKSKMKTALYLRLGVEVPPSLGRS